VFRYKLKPAAYSPCFILFSAHIYEKEPTSELAQAPHSRSMWQIKYLRE